MIGNVLGMDSRMAVKAACAEKLLDNGYARNELRPYATRNG